MTQRKASEEEIDKALSGGGIVFRKASATPQSTGVKTKAKKKTYIRGTHGSAAAKHKAEIRRRRAARPSQRKGK